MIKKLDLVKIMVVIHLLFLSCTTLYAQTRAPEYVLFGEHLSKVNYDIENEYHLHLDQNGDFYPDFKILDNDLRDKGKNQLVVWAKEFPIQFALVAKQYKLEQTNYSVENYSILQDSIQSNIAKKINLYSNEKSQTWLIHGFRKNLYQPATYVSRTSLIDNRTVKKRINTHLKESSKKQTYFVEVYWDGKYIFFSKRNAIKLAKMFKKAIPNAKACGYSLRSVFNKIDSDSITVITHSTGTFVGTNLLFNVDEKFNYTKPTPNQTIKLVLVASASPGKKLFKHYYSRNTTFNFKENDNYTIINAFNTKDNVLRINLLYPLKASTKLGCDYRNESGKLLNYFNKNFQNSTYLEFSIPYTNRASHYLHSYVNHPDFKAVFNTIYY